MNFLLKSLLAFTFLVISKASFSQTNDNLITHTHYYSFSGDSNCNKDKINQLQDAVQKIEFVSEVTVKYGAEKQAGLMKVITREKPVVNEGDHVFSPAELKNTLLRFNLSPINYSIEDGAK